ncbi:MAG: ferritin-like domain-containing protein [Burkholderiales bacterium]|nr:ferritin-like domain-containing protein [Burkholderiales bacterium]
MEMREAAYSALCEAQAADKVQAVQLLWAQRETLTLDTQALMQDASHKAPGRPDKPLLQNPQQVPQRSVHTDKGLAALVHSVCHIEFNAINLALDAVWRFAGLPHNYYQDWLSVAYEESTHFVLLQNLLGQMGYAYGDFAAHDGLWSMCEKTADDVLARMALVPRTLEARGLDATPLIQAKLLLSSSPHATAFQSVLGTILRDEVGHVAIGNHWFRYLCAAQGLDPLDHYPALVERHAAPRLKPPFNSSARLAAGFTQEEIDWLMAQRLTAPTHVHN